MHLTTVNEDRLGIIKPNGFGLIIDVHEGTIQMMAIG